MGCRKLTYYTTETTPLKVVTGNAENQRKVAQGFINVDPLAHMRSWVSPYNFVQNNPISRIDPDGRLDDWIENEETGQVEWREEVTSEETTPEGYKYLGEEYKGLSILKYGAHGTRGVGVEIKAGYNDGEEGDADARWVQTIRTNEPLGGATSPYNDPQPGDDDKPFYWTDSELPGFKGKDGQDLIFYDRPSRSGSKDGTTWEGELSLVVKDGDAYKPVITIRYGFDTEGGAAKARQIIVHNPSDFQKETINDYNEATKK